MSCDNSSEPFEPNVTIETRRSAIKWNAWIDPATPTPTLTTNGDAPGLYEEGRYCSSGVYRPTADSKMRSLGRPFEQINTEQLVKRIYNLVSPIDAATPLAPAVTAVSGQTLQFLVQPQRPADHVLNVLWFVDGRSVSTEMRYLLAAGTLPAGEHTVSVIVRDPTPLVRNDPSTVLEDSRSWTVRISARTLPLIRVLSPNGGERLPGNEAMTVTWQASDPDGLQRFDLSVSTDGVQFHTVPACTGLAGAARSCTWTPAMTTTQAWVRVTAVDRVGTAAQDASDLPFAIVAPTPRAMTILQALARTLSSARAGGLRTSSLEAQLAQVVESVQRGRTAAMCGQLRAFAHHLDAASVRRVRAAGPLRTDTRAAIAALGCSVSK